jgi:hypothetical protein
MGAGGLLLRTAKVLRTFSGIRSPLSRIRALRHGWDRPHARAPLVAAGPAILSGFAKSKTSERIRVHYETRAGVSLAPQKRKNLAKRRGSFLGASGLEPAETEVGGFTDG